MPLTIEQTLAPSQAVRDAAETFGEAWRMNSAGKFGLSNVLAQIEQHGINIGLRRAAEILNALPFGGQIRSNDIAAIEAEAEAELTK